MRGLIQEACQGPVRDAVAAHGSAVANISEDDLRPVILRDFQVCLGSVKQCLRKWRDTIPVMVGAPHAIQAMWAYARHPCDEWPIHAIQLMVGA